MVGLSSPPNIMTTNSPPRVVWQRGLSLLELTVVIAAILTILSILFVGTRAWKRASERTTCILTLRNVQMATRSYQNLYGYNYGGRPYAEQGTQDIAEHLHHKGYIEDGIYEQLRGGNKCAAGGTYNCPQPDIFPQEGSLYMECSLSETAKHVPSAHHAW
jgi:type II secretory pathway pseudopilin PulG